MTPTRHILIIEDNPGDADLIREMVADAQPAAFRFAHVETIADGVRHLREHGADLVLLDLGLPDCSGLETIRTIRRAAPHVPVVVLTGHEDEKTGMHAVKEGAQDYLVKGNVSGALLAKVMHYAVERHQTQEALRASEQFIRSALDALAAHIAILDPSGTILSVNQAWLAFARENGAGRGDGYVGTNYLDECLRAVRRDERTAGDFADGIRAVIQGETEVFDLEYPCHSPDRKRWFHGRVTPFPGSGPRRVIIAHENITDRKLAENQFKASELRLRLVLDTSPNCVFIEDIQGRFVLVNKAVANLFGVSKAFMIGKTQAQIAAFGFRADEARIVQSKAAIQWTEKDVPFVTPAGSTCWFRMIQTPISFPDSPDCTLNIGIDLTERYALENQLRQAQKMESLGTLAGGIAHDFNNILSAILGYTQLALEKTSGSAKVQEYLTEVHQAGIRATDLVRQILTFSRRTDTDLAPLDISLIIKEALKLLRSTLPTSITIKQQIEKHLGWVLADPTQIHQIIMNLCTNASHAMEPYGGELSVTLCACDFADQKTLPNPDLVPGNYLKLTVGDTGCGMPADIMASIFDPYFTTKDLGEGTGLGLSVVHGIVKDYGGDISVASAVGEGSTFTILFPAVRARAQKNDATAVEILPTGTEHILLIDDEPPILKLVSQLLGMQGYRVTADNDSRHALERFEANPGDFDLVLSDVTMPKITGDRLARKMLALRPDIPIVLCTGYSRLITEQQAESIGVRALMHKPIVKRRLLTEIRRLLTEIRRLLDETQVSP